MRGSGGRGEWSLASDGGECQLTAMSLVQLQEELKKLTPQEKLALADYLVIQAGDAAEPSSTQLGELDRRYADALAYPERLIEPEEALRRLKR